MVGSSNFVHMLPIYIVTLSPRFCHTTPLLQQLHWLPVRSRIHFKVSLLTYKAVHLHQPPSLAKHLRVRTLDKDLRSQSGPTLHYTPGRAGYGRKTFRFFAPEVWNSIPSQIRSAPSVQIFRKQLKTHLFSHPIT